MDKEMLEITEFFHDYYGSYTASAKALGIASVTYRGIRRGWIPLSEKMRALIKLKYLEVTGKIDTQCRITH